MAGTTPTWAKNVLDFLTGRAVAYTAPRTTYVSLLTADPTPEDGTAINMAALPEITTPGYARQQVSWVVPSGTPATTANNALVFFGPFTADMADSASHVALVTTASGISGDLVYVWPIDGPLQAATNESLQIAAGALTLNL
jgi:hypothetical protein